MGRDSQAHAHCFAVVQYAEARPVIGLWVLRKCRARSGAIRVSRTALANSPLARRPQPGGLNGLLEP